MSNFNVKTIKPSGGFKYRIQQPKKKSGFKFKGGVFFVFVVFLLIMFTYVLPRVSVTVVPFTQDVEQEFAVQLTTDQSKIDNENVFLAEIVQVNQEVEGKFEATGEKDVGNKASGEVRFFNHTGRSQPLTTNIDLISDSGVVVVVKENVTIPGAKVDEEGNVVAGELMVAVEAKEPGEKGNIGPGRVNISALEIAKQEKIYGEIQGEGLSGGTSKIVRVVSQEDIDNAKEQLIKDVEQEIKEKLLKQAGDNMFISDQLMVYDDSEIYKAVAVDEEQENFELGMNLKIKAMVYNNKNLREFLRDKILASLPQGQTIADAEFSPEDSGLEITVQNFDIDLGLADLKIKATFPVSESIDLNEIKQNILGKKQTEARRYILSLDNVKDVHFSFSFSLTDKIPNSESRVRIKLGESK